MKPRLKRIFTALLGGILKALFRVKRTCGLLPAAPRRLLLLNPTHVGDIIISTSLLTVLKSAYPNLEIGFATATWSHAVVHGHPLVTYTHTIDHWRMSRENLSLFQKLRRYAKTRSKAMREIRSLKYDVAISLHNGSIDLLNLSWQAGIPERVAFSSSFWSALATRIAEYPEQSLFLHHGASQAELLRALGIHETHFACRKSSLAPSSPNAMREVSNLLGVASLESGQYSVIHMGAGMPFKELSPEFWREVASALSPYQTVLFTGKGAREHRNIERAIAGLPSCINACSKLSWSGFVAAIRHADCLYGADSMAGHVAAAVGTMSSTVSHGASGVARWRPEGHRATVWTNPVPCAPCRKARGCATMDCLSGIQPLLLIDSLANVVTAEATGSDDPAAVRDRDRQIAARL